VVNGDGVDILVMYELLLCLCIYNFILVLLMMVCV
jgi:hypothetical protein